MTGPMSTCAYCGRNVHLRSNARFCTAACRTAAYRQRNTSPKRHKPSGLQLSWCKAVDVLAREVAARAGWDFWDGAPEARREDYRRIAAAILAPAPPARQRARLDGRQS